MAVSMIIPKFQWVDGKGKPLAFGKVYTYQARTNTPKPTYQSEDQKVENTNPVILNGEGYADIYLDGSYKIVLKDDKDNEVWSADPVSEAAAGNGLTYVLTAYYLTSSSFKVLGDHLDVMAEGARVEVGFINNQSKQSTVITGAFDGKFTTVEIEDSFITTDINTASLSTGVSAVSDFEEDADAQLAAQEQEFQGRFAFSQPALPWLPNSAIEDSLQLYSTGVIGESGYTVWLADPALLPFTTSATFAEDEALGRWTASTVATRDYALKNSIARSLNVLDSDVIYDTDTVTPIPAYIYSASQQKTYSIPSDAQGKTIKTLTGATLTTSDDAAYQLINGLNYQVFPTVQAMRSGGWLLAPGMKASTSGYYAAGDNGGANYLIVETLPSELIADDKANISLSNGMYAQLLHNGTVTPRMCGAIGDGGNAADYIQAAFNTLATTIDGEGIDYTIEPDFIPAEYSERAGVDKGIYSLKENTLITNLRMSLTDTAALYTTNLRVICSDSYDRVLTIRDCLLVGNGSTLPTNITGRQDGGVHGVRASKVSGSVSPRLDLTVADTTIRDVGVDGLSLATLQNASNNFTIENCIIDRTRRGAVLCGSGNYIIRGTTLISTHVNSLDSFIGPAPRVFCEPDSSNTCENTIEVYNCHHYTDEDSAGGNDVLFKFDFNGTIHCKRLRIVGCTSNSPTFIGVSSLGLVNAGDFIIDDVLIDSCTGGSVSLANTNNLVSVRVEYPLLEIRNCNLTRFSRGYLKAGLHRFINTAFAYTLISNTNGVPVDGEREEWINVTINYPDDRAATVDYATVETISKIVLISNLVIVKIPTTSTSSGLRAPLLVRECENLTIDRLTNNAGTFQVINLSLCTGTAIIKGLTLTTASAGYNSYILKSTSTLDSLTVVDSTMVTTNTLVSGGQTTETIYRVEPAKFLDQIS